MILLASLSVYTYMLRYREVVSPPPPDLTGIPVAIGDYVSIDKPQPADMFRDLGADATVFRSYRSGEGHMIWLFLGYFGTQQENSQIHSPKHCYPGSGWNIVRESTLQLSLPAYETSVKDLVISDGRQRREVIYWFEIRGGVITDEFALKWYQMKSALLQRPQMATFIRFSSDISPGSPERSREELVRFIEMITPLITVVLRGQPVPTDDRSG
jgi:EpsI family protein